MNPTSGKDLSCCEPLGTKTGPADADLSPGVCWRCSDHFVSVHPVGSAICIRPRGPTLPPFRLAFACGYGAYVFRCGNRGCIRGPLDSAPKSGWTLRGNASLPRVGSESSLSFFRRSIDPSAGECRKQTAGWSVCEERDRKVLCVGDFDGTTLGSLRRADSRLDPDWSGDSGTRCAIFVLAVVLCARCRDLSGNCAFHREQSLRRSEAFALL